MAIAILAATARGVDDDFPAANPGGAGNKVPNINSFDLSSGSGSRVTSEFENAGDSQSFLFEPLPPDAEFILPGGFEQEWTTRRAGGSTGGTADPFIRNFDAGARKFGTTFGGGLADNPMTERFQTYATSSDDSVWEISTVNGIAVGWETIAQSSGINYFFMVLNVTWGSTGGAQVVDGIGWLGPLIAAGLRGLNLLRLRDDELVHFDRQVCRRLWRRAGLKVIPALSMPDERERVLWELFREPRYAFLGR